MQASHQLELTLRAIEKQLAKLKQQGTIKRIGPDKGGYWEIVNA
jgi:ATP-dependent DNA helicase RecG